MPKPVDLNPLSIRGDTELDYSADHTAMARRATPISATGSSSFSLVTLFQILTACCIFFAILRVSPLLAIIGTVVTTPAIIRTAIAADLYQRHGVKFKWVHRIRCFLESTGLTVVTLALSATVFVLISLAFGLFSVGASYVIGANEMLADIALVGTIGGMVWGAAGSILAFGLCVRKWQPEVVVNPKRP